MNLSKDNGGENNLIDTTSERFFDNGIFPRVRVTVGGTDLGVSDTPSAQLELDSASLPKKPRCE